MTKVLIFSDSHGENSLMKLIIEKEKPNIKIHLGDYCVSESFMESNFDFYVKGNNDIFGEKNRTINIDGINFLLVHGDMFNYFLFQKDIYWKEEMINFLKNNKCDVLLFGHTHKPYFFQNQKYTIINPGSINLPRQESLKKSYAILFIDNGKILNSNFNEIIKFINN